MNLISLDQPTTLQERGGKVPSHKNKGCSPPGRSVLAWSTSLGKLQVSLYLPGEKITLGTACNYSSSPPTVQLRAKYLVIRESKTMQLGFYLAPCHSLHPSQLVYRHKGSVSPTPGEASFRSFQMKTGSLPCTEIPTFLLPGCESLPRLRVTRSGGKLPACLSLVSVCT